MSIMDRDNPEELAWIRRNITILRKEKRDKKTKKEKRSNNLS